MGWLFLAVVIGVLIGCVLPLLWCRFIKQAPPWAGRQAEQAPEQMLTEWLYGNGSEPVE